MRRGAGRREAARGGTLRGRYVPAQPPPGLARSRRGPGSKETIIKFLLKIYGWRHLHPLNKATLHQPLKAAYFLFTLKGLFSLFTVLPVCG